MNIVPLSKENIEQVIELAHGVFPDDAISKNPPEKGFRKSLLSDEERLSWGKMGERNLARLNYWVLLDEGTKKVIGVTGLYSFNDPKEVVWLAWFCLDPSTRGKGLGKELLRWTMTKAKAEGYTTLRLYTSTDPNEATAQKMYESFGLKIVDEKEDPDSKYKILYRERKL